MFAMHPFFNICLVSVFLNDQGYHYLKFSHRRQIVLIMSVCTGI